MTTFNAASSLVTRLRAIVWNAWIFDTIAEGGVIGTPIGETPPIFSRSSLDRVRTVFEDRAAEEARYRTGAYRFADPSQ